MGKNKPTNIQKKKQKHQIPLLEKGNKREPFI